MHKSNLETNKWILKQEESRFSIDMLQKCLALHYVILYLKWEKGIEPSEVNLGHRWEKYNSISSNCLIKSITP